MKRSPSVPNIIVRSLTGARANRGSGLCADMNTLRTPMSNGMVDLVKHERAVVYRKAV